MLVVYVHKSFGAYIDLYMYYEILHEKGYYIL